jgi:hypothetical protein
MAIDPYLEPWNVLPDKPEDEPCDHGNATSMPISTCRMTPECPARQDAKLTKSHGS